MITVLDQDYRIRRELLNNCKYVVVTDSENFNTTRCMSWETRFDRYGFNRLRDAVRFAIKLNKWWTIKQKNNTGPLHIEYSCSIGEILHNYGFRSELNERIRKEIKGRKIVYTL